MSQVISPATVRGWENTLPALLTREAFVQKRKHLGDIELNIFQVKVFQAVLLHLEQIVEFEVQLQQPTSTTYKKLDYMSKQTSLIGQLFLPL